MSDSELVIIPEDPTFVPSEEQIAAASACLASRFPEALKIAAAGRDGIVFHDCGGSFERVACPGCDADIQVELWQHWMDGAFDGEWFRLDPISLPCCGTVRTLHDLRYERAQGFSRFSLTAVNPNADHVDDSTRYKVEHALGGRIRTIFRHY